MRRITPEEVLKAYEETKIIPVNKDWGYRKDDGTFCGCALTAIACQELTYLSFNSIISDLEDGAEEVLEGLSKDYILGFVEGYDGLSLSSEDYYRDDEYKDYEQYMQGYEDGQACWEAVKQKYNIQ
jgi:hypothetical protein